ncbi:CLUMA_CG003216, isoform B [Clunio marinus]|uniref:CLUMA_CG003216, isoform B n=1 Tax=Clunio marinus TaxID=568069 RepID=A0A1J1HN49_9DIPT|nr:CLUMA_CG003216, isoform B [Clunio marinus]
MMNTLNFITAFVISIIFVGNVEIVNCSPKDSVVPNTGCYHQGTYYNNQKYVYTGPFNGNGCTLYYCINGKVVPYKSIPCDPPPNAYCEPIFHKGECCPTYDCPRDCIYDGVAYANGVYIYTGPFNGKYCPVYFCIDGEIKHSKSIPCDPKPHPNCVGIHIEGECCPKWDCPSDCVYDDVTYANGDYVYTGPFNGKYCPVYYCIDGEIVYSKSIPCDPKPHPNCVGIHIEGECCPKWDCTSDCVYNGVTYADEDYVYTGPFNGKYCPVYHCVDGEIIHYKSIPCEPAPYKDCVGIHIEGECCPKWDCSGDCVYNGVTYANGDYVYTGPFNGKYCPEYFCDYGEIVHFQSTHCDLAPHPNCVGIFIKGECCPKWDCPSDCVYNGVTYSDGDYVYTGPFNGITCPIYYCIKGAITYYQSTYCPPPPHPQCIAIMIKGQCCPKWDCGKLIIDEKDSSDEPERSNEPDEKKCRYNNKVYNEGDTILGPFDGRGCTMYECHDGKPITLDFEICEPPSNPDSKATFTEGECCPKYDSDDPDDGNKPKIEKCVPVY